ncbi:hypothetical protein B5G12_03470 [Faecalibacterium sp. An58]|uniref:DUF3846 domain-containing protein n=1 Tax=Faecalibacterium sp. An58 TaxID=1965648 RepID=UPI000B385DC3|nr:DUF3846 domain-containing protein [Faecalibacterium sp. An58]OUN75355.1 hypothetical protein B5G12_03470 [Faecalibacterium sp. An58]
MKILRVEPEKSPEIVDMDGTLEALQAAVGGYIEAVYPFDDPVAIVCNDDGKFNGMRPNRAIYDADGEIMDIIAGTFLIVGLDEDNFAELSDEMAAKYVALFGTPEAFLRSGDRILVFPMGPDPDVCPF